MTKGSWEARVVDALEPLPDELVLPKGSSWAPTHANWGHDDRTVCVRVKSRDCAPGDAYIEYTRGVVAFTRASGVGTPST